MWSEEELRDILPDPPAPRARQTRIATQSLRDDILTRNATRAAAHPHTAARASILYTPEGQTHGNFHPPSYRRILANPAWRKRLTKTHTTHTGASELDTATSSDALLMNLFCAPRVLTGPALPALLGIDRNETPHFGYRAQSTLHNDHHDRTEIDLKLGPLLIEAKLTESDFQSAPIRLLERYQSFPEVFDAALLPIHRGQVLSYQLIRGVLATQAESVHTPESTFCVLCDRRRPDLIESWYSILRAVRPYDLRARLRVHTWQELAAVLPRPLQLFLAEKYGIEP